MDLFSLVILFLLISSTLQPLLQARYLAMQRAGQIAAIEKERNSCVITMIHRLQRRSHDLELSETARGDRGGV
jgi:hypothetical protein